MSDPGLSHRLRQRSRRAGLMIGLSMVFTIAVCAMGFTVIYSALDGVTSDFISRSEDTPTPIAQVAENDNDSESADDSVVAAVEENPENGNQNQPDTSEGNGDSNPVPTPTPEQDANEEEDGEDAEEDGFNPDYQLGGVTVNLRSGPSTSDSIVTALPPATPLQYLDEDAPTTSPEDGDRWMRFTTEDGLEGWIREIDVDEYEP